jgi:hypothetical protein
LAVDAAPGYVPSRFNLACELALKSNADAAIKELEHLFRIGTPSARKFLSKTRFDSDFDPIRSDPRMKRIASEFVIDFDRSILDQLCADPGKVGTIVKAKLGLYTVDKRGKIKHVDGGKARGAVYDVLYDRTTRIDGSVFSVPGFCTKEKDDNGVRYRPPKSVLSKWNGMGRRCMVSNTRAWGPLSVRGILCFYEYGGSWVVGIAEGGKDHITDHFAGLKSRAKKLFQ